MCDGQCSTELNNPLPPHRPTSNIDNTQSTKKEQTQQQPQLSVIMSDRLPSAAEISIGTYYEQQHQQQQQQRPTEMASAMAKSTMHFPSALQQRLHDYQSPSNGFAAPRYHSAAIAATAATAAAAGNYGPAFSPYGSLHYGGVGGGGGGVASPAYGHSYADQHQHQQQQPHPHYDSIYNGRLIGGGAMSGFYGGRDRYFPYPPHHAQPQQQQHRHAMRGMFTPAGQQLVPSSVLHYPPRGAAYQPPPPPPSTPTQQQQQQHTHFTPHQYQQQSHLQPQQQQQQRTSDGSLYARNEPQLPQPQQLLQLYPQRSPYLQMHLNGAQRHPSPTPTPTPTPSLSPGTAPPIPSPSLSHNVRPAIVGGYNPYQPPHQQQQQPVASPSAVGSQQSALHEAITATHHQRQQQQQAQDQQQQQQQLGQMYTENRCNASSSDLPNTSEQSFTNADCKDDARLFTPSATASCPTVIMPNHHSASTVSSPTNSTAPTLGDCLTTSPPLISATGTDSGISSCSTRARSDSTQSTPVYSGEYPNSVGSSSGVSYHCADVKDFEEMSKEKDEPTVAESNAMAQGEVGHSESCGTQVKQEIFDNEDLVKMKTECEDKNEDVASAADAHLHQTESNAIKNVDIVSDTASSTQQQQIRDDDQTPNCTANQLPKTPRPTHNNSQVDAPGPESPNTTPTEAGNTSVSASGASMIASSADERSGTPSRQAPSSSPVTQPQQQQQHSPALHQNAPNPICSARSAASLRDSSWPPFPGSPHSRQQQQLEQSSPPVPVPPHNSPGDYSPSPTHPAAAAPTSATKTTTKTTAIPAATAATLVAKKHKNRIMECDLIPSKKSKRNPSSAEPASESDAREEMRDMTPLPGFQQAFGSTEIGRFFESFLLRPAESNAESVDTFDMEQQQQQQLQHHQQQLQHQQQQQQHHYAADYLGSVYGEGSYHQRPPHHHPAYYNRHAYAHSYHHHLWPHARPSPYDSYEYGVSRSGTAGGAAAVAPFNFHYGSGYNTMRDMLSLERMSYSYGRLNGGYGGIRCNGY